jgi:hypothetical protein
MVPSPFGRGWFRAACLLTAWPNTAFFLCSMLLSEILDPRRYAAEKAAAAARADEGAC